MKTFEDLKFKPDTQRDECFRASMTLEDYTLSVVYGSGLYGDGPTHDTYEMAVYQSGHEDLLPLSDDDDVLGWQNSEEITRLMRILQTEPDFGEALRLIKRTRYVKQFIRTTS